MPNLGAMAGLVRPDILTAAARFPVAAASAIAATCLIILRTEDIVASGDLHEQRLYGLLVAFLASAAFGIWLDGRGHWAAVAGQIAAIGLGVLGGFALFALWLSPPLLATALALAVVAAPGLARGGSATRFWTYNIRSGFAALIGAAGAAVLFVGLLATLETLKSLFNLNIPYRLWSHASTVSGTLLLPLYWLAFQPRVAALDAEGSPPDILSRAVAAITDFALLPLLVVYTVILHVYAVKIALDGTLPQGRIGWFVSVFLALGYLLFLIAYAPRSPLPRLRRLFRLVWPAATIIPVVLLALALQTRVAAYGITQDRIAIAVIALAAIVLVVAWLPRRSLDPRLVPLVGAALVLVTSIGPLSARLISVQTQSARFVAILETSGELQDGRFDGERSTPWDNETRDELASIMRYLQSQRALNRLAPVMGAEHARSVDALTSRLAIWTRTPQAPVRETAAAPRPRPLNLGFTAVDADIVFEAFQFEAASGEATFSQAGQPTYALRRDGLRLVLAGPDASFTFDLSARPDHIRGSLEAPRAMTVVRADDPRAVLVLQRLTTEGSGEGRRVTSVGGLILLRGAAP